MLKTFKAAAVATLALGGAALGGGAASALPALDTHPVDAVRAGAAPDVEQARIVCGPFRCFYRPGYYGYYHRPFYGYGYGYHRHYGYYGYHHPFGYGFRRF